MSNAFVKHLSGYGLLGEAEKALLEEACKNVRELPAGTHLIREGDEPDPVFVILEGWACGYKILPDGGRQIISFMLPGDFCDIHIAILHAIDHNIMTLTKTRVASLPRAEDDAGLLVVAAGRPEYLAIVDRQHGPSQECRARRTPHVRTLYPDAQHRIGLG